MPDPVPTAALIADIPNHPQKEGAPMTMIRNVSMWVIIGSAIILLAGASLL